jgi:hypothetical protein
MLRNWANQFAFQVGRFLFYWRLVGVALFELTSLRPLLLFFPNVFEYFFIFWEVCCQRWDPRRMTRGVVIGAAASIWILIKLPQEYWIHIAQLDMTDFVKERVLGLSPSTPWSEILGANLWIFPTAVVVGALAGFLIGRFARRLPAASRSLAFAADAHQPTFSAEQARRAWAEEARSIIDSALVEKAILVTLVSLIFAQVLPDVQASSLQLSIGVAIIVMINTAFSHWLARSGFGPAPVLLHFVAMGLFNAGLFVIFALLLPYLGGHISLASAFFFVALLTLIVTLFDQYRQVYLMRFTAGGSPPGQGGLQALARWLAVDDRRGMRGR